jgi:DNA-binding response OmpR family regulator
MSKEPDVAVRLSELAELLPTAALGAARSRRALVLEDDIGWQGVVKRLLEDKGWRVDIAEDLSDARRIAGRAWFDLMIVDRQLPDGDGLDFIAALRKAKIATPAIVLTAMHQGDIDEIEKAAGIGLNIGADDYVPKSFSEATFSARVDAQVRRAGREGSYSYWPFQVDFIANRIDLYGERLELPQRDTSMLALMLCLHPVPVAKWRFLDLVWTRYRVSNGGYAVQHNTIDSAISILKRNLSELGVPAKFIRPAAKGEKVVSGRGIVFDRAWRLHPEVFPSSLERTHGRD